MTRISSDRWYNAIWFILKEEQSGMLQFNGVRM